MIAITIKQKKPLVCIAICYMAPNSMAISFKNSQQVSNIALI